MLSLQMLEELPPGIFAYGSEIVFPSKGQPGNTIWRNWVAVRGQIHDWAIYYAIGDKKNLELHWPFERIAECGDKIHSPSDIKELVACTDEAFKMYRH